MTPSEIETATFRLLTQSINQLRYRVPYLLLKVLNIFPFQFEYFIVYTITTGKYYFKY
jgi:hypothetical protein